MFSFLYKLKPLLIVGGIIVVLFLTNGGAPPPASMGIQAVTHMQDQATQTDYLLTDYIVVEYV